MFVFELNSPIKCRVERNFATLPQNEFKVRAAFRSYLLESLLRFLIFF